MFTEIFPILSTPDLPRALAFYQDLLGMTETYRFPQQGDPVYVGLKLGACELGVGVDPDAREGPLAYPRFDLCLYTDDCDAAVEHLRAAGVQVIAEAADQPWGERMARVADPDGNGVVLMARA